MDLITELGSKLGIGEDKAQAIAGTVMGMVSGAVKGEHGDSAAAQVEAAVPEMGDWKERAAGLLGGAAAGGGLGGMLGGLAGGGGAGGLLGGALSSLGGGQAADIAGLIAVLSKLGIDGSKAALVAPIALQFLKSRLDPGLVTKVLSAVPMLTGGGDAPATGGGIGGMLGGLFR